ncbi:MAG TPA: isocitrate/isopropylmalate dehydrogenase family protein [Planctomycetaceae bacterium]|nr:isocitrate/isopropylmalate dehydrogenase family protein [Planctomycetaceae bacterium]
MTAARNDDSQELTIAVLPGDGIGPEVMDAAIAVLQRLQQCLPDLKLQLRPCAAGAAEYLRSGSALPTATLQACHDADAVLLAAMGLPHVRQPDGREVTPQIDLREHFQLYQGIRPVYLYHAMDSPLKQAQPGDIDLLILRENTEGLFHSRGRRIAPEAETVDDILRVTRVGSERLFHAAFQLARQRRHHVTLVDKANVLPSMVRFRQYFDQVAQLYPDVQTDRMYVDAAALHLVRRPQSFDVLVTENMFGDILSDLAAALVGGMGMAPSADVGAEVAVFQPCHGTAPDIAGQGIANPLAMILSLGLMLDWLQTPACRAAAGLLRKAIPLALQDPQIRTPDLGGTCSTQQMTDAVLASLNAD